MIKVVNFCPINAIQVSAAESAYDGDVLNEICKQKHCCGSDNRCIDIERRQSSFSTNSDSWSGDSSSADQQIIASFDYK